MGLQVVRVDPGEPKYGCLVCGAQFYDGEHRAYERHVTACGNRNEAELRAQSLRAKAPGLFDPTVAGDVEYGEWYDRNRKAIAEGRVKP